MDFGKLIYYGLNKAELPFDAANLEMAKIDANFIIQDLWYRGKPEWRSSSDTISLVSGSNEYALNKFFDRFIKNSLQGPSNWPIHFSYLTKEEFFRKVQLNQSTSGRPWIYTLGQIIGYDVQLSSASTISIVSSRANDTTSTVTVSAGSDRVLAASAAFSRSQVGLRFKKSGDTKTYKIGKYISPTEIQLIEKYRGVSASGASYSIGDIGVFVNISGFVSGQYRTEVLELNGDTTVTGTVTFDSIVSLSKTDITGGNVVITKFGGSQTIGTMAPAETQIERQTVLIWTTPDSSATLTYHFYMKHPFLWLDSDRILIPEKWHRLIAMKLEKKLAESSGQEVSAGLEQDIEKAEYQFENEMEDAGLMDSVPDGDKGIVGEAFYFDKLPPGVWDV